MVNLGLLMKKFVIHNWKYQAKALGDHTVNETIFFSISSLTNSIRIVPLKLQDFSPATQANRQPLVSKKSYYSCLAFPKSTKYQMLDILEIAAYH